MVPPSLQSRQRTQTGPQALYKLSWITSWPLWLRQMKAQDRQELQSHRRSSQPREVLPLRGLLARTEGDTFSCHNWEMLPHRLARGQSLLTSYNTWAAPKTQSQPTQNVNCATPEKACLAGTKAWFWASKRHTLTAKALGPPAGSWAHCSSPGPASQMPGGSSPLTRWKWSPHAREVKHSEYKPMEMSFHYIHIMGENYESNSEGM